MYHSFLLFHSLIRWVIFLLLVYLVPRAVLALLTKAKYHRVDRILSGVLLGFVHLQFILGLSLYFLFSPIIKMVFANSAVYLKQAQFRFWAIEHAFLMVCCVACVQMGFSFSKRVSQDQKKFRYMAIFFGVALVLIILGMPWPGLPYGRPFFPLTKLG